MHCSGYFPLLEPVYLQGKYVGTKLDQLNSLPKRARPESLNYEDIPEGMAYIMDHFYNLRKATQAKISYTELKNYTDVLRFNFHGWEIDLIMQIDDIYEACINGNRSKVNR